MALNRQEEEAEAEEEEEEEHERGAADQLKEAEPPLSSHLTKLKTGKDISSSSTPLGNSSRISSDLPSPNLKSSPCISPSLISPSSSAFVSALQSPYISPRATTLPPTNPTPPTPSNSNPFPSSLVSSFSQSEDIPSSSYTPPSDQYDFSDGPLPDSKQFKYATSGLVPPRISFSFQVPRVSFKGGGPISPASNAKLRNCDVYIGFHGHNPNLMRFCKWLKCELELQGIACFIADRAKYLILDCQSHEVADRVICSVTYGVVVVTNASFLNPLSLEEIRFFAQKKNLIPLFFDIGAAEVTGLLSSNSVDKECREAIDGLIKANEFKLEANAGNWRSCVARTSGILRSKLGRKSVVEKDAVAERFEELPFTRNKSFVGRETEIMEIEAAFFGCFGENVEQLQVEKGEASGQSEGLADEESETGPANAAGGRYINLELGGKCKEPKLEAWVEPIVGRTSLMKRSKYKSKSGNYRTICGSNVVCINGVAGIGKTELALEFAYRYSQRYKMVLWIGGEARYLRQNILNLSLNLGLDVSADAEKERGRIRSFEEQELEAFKRVKRELFHDMPYLIIIDNLEAEREWWEGKDMHDFIPRNTGGTHLIITTRLSKVMNHNMMQLTPLSPSDSMALMRGKRKRDYPREEMEFFEKFDEKLGRLTYGLWIVGSLLSELAVFPSALFEAVNQIPIEDLSAGFTYPYMSITEELLCKNNPFLMKLVRFCFIVLEQTNGTKNLLASRMLRVGAWFAPAPISSTLLAAAAKDLPTNKNGLRKWAKCLNLPFACCSGCGLAPQSEEDSAILLVKLGLARKANRQQPSCWIQFHPITQVCARRKEGIVAAKAAVLGVRKFGNTCINSDHQWASAFLIFGFKSEPPLVQLRAIDMVLYIKKTALPLAIRAFTRFSRCNSALELLKVCTDVLEEVEKSFVSQIQDWCSNGSLCWKKKKIQQQQPGQGGGHEKVDEYVWQDVTLLKATLLESRAKLLLRGGHFDSSEDLCRTCISIRTVMLGHNHALTLAAQETLAKIVRLRSKI